MKRVYATRELSHREMQALAEILGRCGFPTAAVGKNYIAFYEQMEIRRMTDGRVLQRSRPVLRDSGTTD